MADTVISTITASNGGKKFTISLEHPRDATDEQVQAFALEKLKQSDPDQAYPTPVVERPKPESFLQGVDQGIANVALNIAEGVGNLPLVGGLGDDGSARARFDTEQEAMPTQPSAGGRMAGDMIGTLPTAALRGGAAVQGAVSGALMSNADDTSGVAWDAVKGAAGGVVGGAVLRGAAGLINPQVAPGVRTLLNEGVELTPGQMRGGTIKRLEDIAAKVPVVGEMVQGAQNRANITFNRAAINRSLRPIGEALPRDLEAGNDAVRFAGDRLSAAYNEVLPRLSGRIDNSFSSRIQTIERRSGLPDRMQGQLDEVNVELANAFPQNGQFTGRSLRDTSERLGDLAAGFRRSDDPYVRRLGDVADQYRAQLHSLARRQNPADAVRLRDIDRGYASLVRVERAAAGADEGIFNPAGYKSAVRSSDRSVRKRQTARGEALDQDLGNAATTVMQNRAAQGGSKDVNSLIALSALGAGAMNGSPTAMAGVAGLLAVPSIYTEAGLNASRLAMGRQTGAPSQLVGNLLRLGAQATPAVIAGATNGSGR